MSQAEELLNSLLESEGDHTAGMGDKEQHIVIGRDRSVNVPRSLRKIAVQFDHNVETVTFDCPRYWDKLDMSTMKIYVNYMRADGYMDKYPCKNVVVDATDENIMHFDWTLTGNATQVEGRLVFLVCIKKTDANGNEENHWNSELGEGLYVSEGMECDETILAKYPDIITHLLMRMEEVEGAKIVVTGEQILALQNKINTEKANVQAEIDVERKRIDKIAKLEEGSTTGDIELIDGRRDYTGKEWDNIGAHVRGVTSRLSSEITARDLLFDDFVRFITVDTVINKSTKSVITTDNIISTENSEWVNSVVVDVNEHEYYKLTFRVPSGTIGLIITDANDRVLFNGYVSTINAIEHENVRITIPANGKKLIINQSTACDATVTKAELTPIFASKRHIINSESMLDFDMLDPHGYYQINFYNMNKDLYHIPEDSIVGVVLCNQETYTEVAGTQIILNYISGNIWIRYKTPGGWNKAWKKMSEHPPLPDGYITVTVGDGGDYSKLTDAISSVEEHTRILVLPGEYDIIEELGEEYFETYDGSTFGIIMPKNCKLEFCAGAKVLCHYTGTNDAVREFFSPINSTRGSVEYENIVIEASNVKYCIHDEHGGELEPYTVTFNRCNLYLDDSANKFAYSRSCIGGGLGKYGTIEVKNSIFESEGTQIGGTVSYHTSMNIDESTCHVNIHNNYFVGNDDTARVYSANTGAGKQITIATINNNSFGKAYMTDNKVISKCFLNEIRQ